MTWPIGRLLLPMTCARAGYGTHIVGTSAARTRCASRRRGGAAAPGSLQEVAREILVTDELAQVPVDVGAVDDDLRAGLIGRIVGDRVEQPLEHGREAPRADVLLALVDLVRDLGQPLDRGGVELELDVLGAEQRAVL